MFRRKLAISLGVFSLPFTGFAIYERFNPLPPPLGDDTGYPYIARVWMRLALWRHHEGYLDKAMQSVIKSGLGPASPQATNLTIQLAQWHVQANDLDALRASQVALLHKPHVGEAIREERRRLLQALTVTKRLYELMQASGKEVEGRQLVKETMSKINSLPPFITRALTAHSDWSFLNQL